MTAALVAQYGAECDHAVRPATDAVRMIDPEPCGRMTATAARMPLTAPSTLTAEGALPVLGRQVVDAAVRRQHAGVAHQDVEPAEALDGQRHHRLDLRGSLHVGEQRRHRRTRVSAEPATVAASDASDTSLSTRAVPGSLARRRATAAPSAPPAPVMATTRTCSHARARRHTRRYPPSTVSTAPVTKAAASEARNW